MSSSISLARSKLNTVKTLIRKGQIFSAVMCVYEAVEVFLKTKLLKHEKRDFHSRIKDALSYITSDKNFIQQYPLKFSYSPGKEKELYLELKKVIDAFQDSMAEEAQKELKALKQKREKLEEGKEFVENEEYAKAESIFKELLKDFPDDSELRIEISDAYLKKGKTDLGLNYLKKALDIDAGTYVLNRLGIVLRKIKKYDVAEKAFLKAIDKSPDDEVLYFNLGRVYIDSGQWSKAEKVAQKALEINPSFEEAKKMLNYIIKNKK